MTLVWVIYAISVLGSVHAMAVLTFCIAAVVALVSWPVYCLCTEEWEKEPKDGALKLFKKTIPVALIAAAVATLVPGSNTMHTMVAAYGVEAVASSEAAGRIAPKSLKVIEQYLDNMLEEDTIDAE